MAMGPIWGIKKGAMQGFWASDKPCNTLVYLELVGYKNAEL